MSRRWFTLAALPALVAAGLFLFADQAQAQRWGRGVSVDYAPGYGVGVGVGRPWYGGYGYGWNNYSPWYGNYGWGNTYSPWYGTRYYSGYYNTYYPSTWDYTWTYPSGTFYGGTLTDNSYGMTTADRDNRQGGYTSFYYNDQGQREQIPDTAALINMRLPANAKVWFFNDETKSQGAMRQYVTPALDTGKVFFYEIRARWNDNGQDLERTHRVLVHAGDRISVDFLRDLTNVDEMTPERLRQRENVRPAEGTRPRTERRFYEEERNGTLRDNEPKREEVPPPPDNKPATDRPNNGQAAPGHKDLPQTDKTVPPAKPDGTNGSQRPPD